MKKNPKIYRRDAYYEIPTLILHRPNIPLWRKDLIVSEEPLEIRLVYPKGVDNWESLTLYTTMRTPGEDEDLVLGLLFSEGVIKSYKDVEYISYCENVEEEKIGNVVNVFIKKYIDVEDFSSLLRVSYMSSACGLCGKLTIEYLKRIIPTCVKDDMFKLCDEYFYSLPDILRKHQEKFLLTGGTHACAAFDVEGNLIGVREDVGRHNAMDKLIGYMLRIGKIPLKRTCIVVSGRASYELVQKALMAGVPILASIGAPSTLAVKLAKEFGMTLIGFLSRKRFVVYNDVGRLDLDKWLHETNLLSMFKNSQSND